MRLLDFTKPTNVFCLDIRQQNLKLSQSLEPFISVFSIQNLIPFTIQMHPVVTHIDSVVVTRFVFGSIQKNMGVQKFHADVKEEWGRGSDLYKHPVC